MLNMKYETATAVVASVISIIVMVALSFPVMWLWNTFLVSAIDGVNEIGALQAFGIMLLCNILFGFTSKR